MYTVNVIPFPHSDILSLDFPFSFLLFLPFSIDRYRPITLPRYLESITWIWKNLPSWRFDFFLQLITEWVKQSHQLKEMRVHCYAGCPDLFAIADQVILLRHHVKVGLLITYFLYIYIDIYTRTYTLEIFGMVE